MTRCWTLLALILACLPATEARSGKNVFTNRFYQGGDRDGCEVRCSGLSCRHGCDRLTVVHEGIRYRGRIRVFRQGRGREWGVQVRVTASSANGLRHGLRATLLLDGTAYRLPPYAPGMVGGFGSGALFGWHLPWLRPGAPVTMRAAHPSGRGAGLTPGHRLFLKVRVAQVLPAGTRRRKSQRLFTVVLTVPRRGPPRVRISPKQLP